MWGSDFPHSEGVYPYTLEALRATFAGIPENEVETMLGDSALQVYGFNRQAVADAAAQFGPLVSAVDEPLAEYPPDSYSPVFERTLADLVPSW
jgi:hypothetical protein